VNLLLAAALALALAGACAEDPPKFLAEDTGDGGMGGASSGGQDAGRDGLGGETARAGDTGGPGGAGGSIAPSAAGAAGEAPQQPPGDGGEGGSGGRGGGDVETACEPATVATDCEQRECFVAMCVDGLCQHAAADAGTECGPSGALYCNGSGDCVACYRDDQCEAESACSVGDCNAEGVCVQQPRGNGESCDDGVFCNGDETCDGGGVCRDGAARCPASTSCSETQRQCSDCLTNDDCPPQTPVCNEGRTCVCESDEHCELEEECRVGRCGPSGVCIIENVPVGTEVGAQTMHDCLSRECDGEGHVDLVAADDPPIDPGTGCSRPACMAGNIVSVFRDPGALCGDGPTECSNQDTCDGSGSCRVNHVEADFVIHQPDSSDCERRTCNGSGGVTKTSVHSVCAGYQTPQNPNRIGHCGGTKCYECHDLTLAQNCGNGPLLGCMGSRCYAQQGCCPDMACNIQSDGLCSRP
jgi:hypothetical protein